MKQISLEKLCRLLYAFKATYFVLQAADLSIYLVKVPTIPILFLWKLEIFNKMNLCRQLYSKSSDGQTSIVALCFHNVGLGSVHNHLKAAVSNFSNVKALINGAEVDEENTTDHILSDLENECRSF